MDFIGEFNFEILYYGSYAIISEKILNGFIGREKPFQIL